MLVVLGILIALQINNWNEDRKERMQEQEILHALKSSTEINLKVLQENRDRVGLYLENSVRVLDLLSEPVLNMDSLANYFPRALLTGFRISDRLDMSGYKRLESAGIEILQSQPLKLTLVDLYETSIPWMNSIGDEWSLYLKDISIQLVRDGIIRHEFGKGFTPRNNLDRDQLDTLNSIMSMRRAQKDRGVRFLNQSIEKCRDILKYIEGQIT